MNVFFTIITIVSAIIGLGTIYTASKTSYKKGGLMLGGISYLLGAIIAFIFSSWWPLLIGFVLAWIVRFFGGDPGKQ
jgi:hypothetical protein